MASKLREDNRKGKLIQSTRGAKNTGTSNIFKGNNKGKQPEVKKLPNGFAKNFKKAVNDRFKLVSAVQELDKLNFKSMKPQQAYDKVKTIAKLFGDKHPEITAAQFCVESGFGQKPSGKFNYFGVKGKGSVVMTKEEIKGKKVPMKQSFVNYSSPIESIAKHIKLKMTSKDFKGYSTASTTDQALSCLKPYATESDYISVVKQVIKQHDKTIARI
jgi:hypothetical protein